MNNTNLDEDHSTTDANVQGVPSENLVIDGSVPIITSSDTGTTTTTTSSCQPTTKSDDDNNTMDYHHEALKEFYRQQNISNNAIEPWLSIGTQKSSSKSFSSTNVQQQQQQQERFTTSCDQVLDTNTSSVRQQQQQQQEALVPSSLLPTNILQHRFVRLNPRYPYEETIKSLKREIREWKKNDLKYHQQQPDELLTIRPENDTINNNNDDNYIDRYPIPVKWINNVQDNMMDGGMYYAIPSNFPLQQQSVCYKNGLLYGQDISSAAAVAVLLSNYYDANNTNNETNDTKVNIEETTIINNPIPTTNTTTPSSKNDGTPTHMRVLDLCCSPGLKLCAIADYLQYRRRTTNQNETNNISNGLTENNNNNIAKMEPDVVVGVDISLHRMNICKRIIYKYQIESESTVYPGEENPINSLETNPTNKSVVQNDDNQPTEHTNTSLLNTTTTITDTTTTLGCYKCDSMKNPIEIRLYCNDGTTFGTNASEFNLIFDSTVSRNEEQQRIATKRKRMNKSARARERKQLQLQQQQQQQQEKGRTEKGHVGETTITNNSFENPLCIELFDRVLVDAECSTDGSMKHLLKQRQQPQRSEAGETLEINPNNTTTTGTNNGTSTTTTTTTTKKISNIQLTDPKKLEELVTLQKQLIQSGYRLLKPGGYMVYSTCSLSEDQNENIVQWLLDKYPTTAQIIPIHFPMIMKNNSNNNNNDDKKNLNPNDFNHQQYQNNNNNNNNNFIQVGTLPGTIQFLPNVSIRRNIPVSIMNTNNETTTSITTTNAVNQRQQTNSQVPNEEQYRHLFGDGFFLAKIRKM